MPILVRPHTETPGRYRIVYGRRRVLAARDLGLPVRGAGRDLDDRAAVMAQGQENTQRRGLSFIEKAHLARQMRDAGYDRAAIADAVNADRTIISRMLAVVGDARAIRARGADYLLALKDNWPTLHDDPMQLRTESGPANMATIRHAALRHPQITPASRPDAKPSLGTTTTSSEPSPLHTPDLQAIPLADKPRRRDPLHPRGSVLIRSGSVDTCHFDASGW